MLLTIVIMVILVALMIAINALYVAGEFAAVSARKSRIQQEANEGKPLARTLLQIIEDHHRLDNYIAASQVGITLSSVVLGIYGQRQIAELLVPVISNLPFVSSEAAAAGISTVGVLIFLTTLQVVLGELVPKSIAVRYPEETALATVVPMRWSAEILLKPFIIILNGSGAFLLKLLGINYHAEHKHIHSPEEIQLLIGESHRGGLIDAEDRRLLDNAFRVGQLTAGEIAVPRTRMVGAAANSTVEQCLRIAMASDYTRIPIYEEDIDHIIGFAHIKDLFRLYYQGQNDGLESIIRKAPYVPETMDANEVWDTLEREQSYLAFVFDEYGGTVGMITQEDLIEELFGEVQDEFDVEMSPLRKVNDREYLVRGDVLISVLNDQLNSHLPTENANTIGGLALHELGRIPEAGDELTINAIHIRIEAATRRFVQELRLTLPESLLPDDEQMEI